MSKKIIFGSIAILFAAATVFNINLLQNKNAGDISLDALTIMAQAENGENCNSCVVYEMVDCKWVTVYVKFDSDGKKGIVSRGAVVVLIIEFFIHELVTETHKFSPRHGG